MPSINRTCPVFFLTKLYAEMYNSQRNVFKWAGLAAFASEAIGDAIANASMLKITDVIPGLPSANEVYEVLSRGNTLLFIDTYRQNLAFFETYTTQGLDVLRGMHTEGLITPDQMQAWRLIDEG